MNAIRRLLPLVLCLGMAVSPAYAQDASSVEEEVRAYTRKLVSDLSIRGAYAWLDHFERSDAFYMASDGRELFPDYEEAERIVLGFAPTIETIQLMLDDLDVYPLGSDAAVFGSPFREILLDTTGTSVSFGGYVSGTTVRDGNRWVLRNLHWSTLPPPPAEEDESGDDS